jgi:phosphatidylglycerophosphatase A
MGAATTTSRRPDLRFLLSHPAHFIALGFGAGLFPFAQGTAGTAIAIPLYWALAVFLPPLVIAFLAIPLFFLGIWACDVTGRNLGVIDHQAICWDEIVAFLPLLALADFFLMVDGASRPRSYWLQGLMFVLFRLFDIWKPFPIRQLEQRLKGGLGVMADDIGAACYAYVAFIVVVVAAHKGLGLE